MIECGHFQQFIYVVGVSSNFEGGGKKLLNRKLQVMVVSSQLHGVWLLLGCDNKVLNCEIYNT